jgi:hypothetical protein
MTRRLFRFVFVGAGMSALAACGHSELRAPCSASEAYASLSAYADPCGPMRRVNEGPNLPPEFRQLLDEKAAPAAAAAA